MTDSQGRRFDGCRCAKMEYCISGIETLGQFLAVVGEIADETGMQDWTLTYHGCRMSYCWTDAKMVAAGEMSEEDYIRRNGIATM